MGENQRKNMLAGRVSRLCQAPKRVLFRHCAATRAGFEQRAQDL
jgi:hypothetical protein